MKPGRDDGGCEYALEGYDCDGNPLTSGVSDLQPTPTITAFPNPSFGRFAIRGLQGEGPHDLMVLDLHGRLLRRERIVASPQADGWLAQPDWALSPGAYLIRIRDNAKAADQAVRLIH